ncbi:MAG: M48 family metallopeptidase [Actinomycetes bacterium]
MPTVAAFRHRAEVPMLVTAGVVSAGAIAIVAIYLAAGRDAPGWATLALLALVAPLMALVYGIRSAYWRTIANGVEVTPRQLPDLYRLYTDLAAEMGFTASAGLEALPRLYVVNGNGTLNAYATKCQLRRAYIVIYSDLLDVAYEFDDFSTIRFVLAHELGHVKEGHVSLWRTALKPIPSLLLLWRSVSRAQEYTADRVASYYAPEGAMGLLALMCGKRIYRRVDADSYLESVQAHKDGFWLRFANYLADHAVGFRRMEALSRVQNEGWNVHGRML